MYIAEKIENYLNEAKKPKVTFNTNLYMRSHGKKPGGTTGGWAFVVDEPELAKLLAKHKNISGINGTDVFVRGSLKLTDAKKAMKKAIIDVYPPDAKNWYVDVEVGP